MIWLSCVSLCLLVWSSMAYPTFRDQLPNGNNVPHPCKPNYMWQGVGHLNPGGGGTRNVFGEAFDEAGYKWTTELCRADSDGDGLTNGQELGDPDCLWSPGQIPARTANITHPGVCDPYDSPACKDKNMFLSCELKGFENCSSIQGSDIRTLNLTFKETQIPATETNYYCMTFDLPYDQDYHIVANEPIIDNAEVMHHILVYGCSDEDKLVIDPPAACGMSVEECGSLMGVWVVGMTGQCFSANTGFRIGKTSIKRIRLEFHYNNPRKVPTYTDASGMRLYIQPAKPEVRDLITFVTGQYMLSIPPGETRVEHTGVCPSECSQQVLGGSSVHVIGGLNHMHYLGYSMKVELYRDEKKIADLTNDEYYSYDSPVNHVHEPPIEVRAGDELRTTCVYNSGSTDRYTFYGDATSDEMCFGLLFVYAGDPNAQIIPGCVSYGPLTHCQYFGGTSVGGCDWKTFQNMSDPANTHLVQGLKKNCNLNGLCRPECQAYVDTLTADNSCLQGDLGQFNKWKMQDGSLAELDFLARLHSCPAQVDCTGQCSDVCPDIDSDNNSAPAYNMANGRGVIALVAILLYMLM